jgi:hypothetical protein
MVEHSLRLSHDATVVVAPVVFDDLGPRRYHRLLEDRWLREL